MSLVVIVVSGQLLVWDPFVSPMVSCAARVEDGTMGNPACQLSLFIVARVNNP